MVSFLFLTCVWPALLKHNQAKYINVKVLLPKHSLLYRRENEVGPPMDTMHFGGEGVGYCKGFGGGGGERGRGV